MQKLLYAILITSRKLQHYFQAHMIKVTSSYPLGDRGLPFFKHLRKSDKFEWNDDASKAFQELKDFLTTPPVLTAPEDGEVLLLYIAATTSVVSTFLVVERD